MINVKLGINCCDKKIVEERIGDGRYAYQQHCRSSWNTKAICSTCLLYIKRASLYEIHTFFKIRPVAGELGHSISRKAVRRVCHMLTFCCVFYATNVWDTLKQCNQTFQRGWPPFVTSKILVGLPKIKFIDVIK